MATALQLTIFVFLILIVFYPTLMSITVMSARTMPAESIPPTAPFHDFVGVPWQSSMAESLFQPNLAKSLFQQMFDSSFSTWNDDPSTFFAPADASIQGWVSTSITPIQGIFSFNYLRKLPFGTQIKNMSKVYLSILSNIDGFRSDIEVPYHAGPTAPFPDLVDLPLPGMSPMAESKDSSLESAQAEAAIYTEDRAISLFLKPILTNTEPEQLQFSAFQIWRFCSPDRLLMNVDLVSIACKACEGLQGFVAPLSPINNKSMVTSPCFAQEGVAMSSMAEPTDSSLLANYFDRFYAGGSDEGVGPQSRLQFRSAIGSAEGKVLPTLATAHKLFDCEISLYTIFSLAAFCTESMANLVSMADIEAKAMELGIDLSTVDFGNIIVVDNLPVVPPEKFEKLEGVIRKIYSQIGMIKNDGLWMPVNPESKKTLGYCFIEFNTPREAELAKKMTHGYKLDKAHIFAVNLFNDFDKFMKVPDEWALPEIKPYTPGETLQQWLTDEKARDQFVIRAESDTEVLWNDPRQLKPELIKLVHRRGYWTESFVHRLRNRLFSGADSADSPFQIWSPAQLECA